MKKILLSTLLISSFLTLSSCGDKKGGRNNLSETEELTNIEAKGLVINLEGVFTKNDVYQIFYTDDSVFTEQNSVKTTVYGQSVLQKVSFQLPEKIKPQNLRLDLGNNFNQSAVSIKKIEIMYNDQILNIEGDMFREYFPTTSSVQYDGTSLEYLLKKNEDGSFDPVMFGSDQVKKGLNKIYNQAKEDK
ncbi:hypothetical protein OBK04_01165 [Empedobacter falsenii]